MGSLGPAAGPPCRWRAALRPGRGHRRPVRRPPRGGGRAVGGLRGHPAARDGRGPGVDRVTVGLLRPGHTGRGPGRGAGPRRVAPLVRGVQLVSVPLRAARQPRWPAPQRLHSRAGAGAGVCAWVARGRALHARTARWSARSRRCRPARPSPEAQGYGGQPRRWRWLPSSSTRHASGGRFRPFRRRKIGPWRSIPDGTLRRRPPGARLAGRRCGCARSARRRSPPGRAAADHGSTAPTRADGRPAMLQRGRGPGRRPASGWPPWTRGRG